MGSAQFAMMLATLMTLVPSLFVAADDQMVERLQGSWSQTKLGPQGEAIRVEKHFEGPTETYTVYQNGEPIYAHIARNYRVRLINQAEHLYAYSVDGFEVTVGPNKG